MRNVTKEEKNHKVQLIFFPMCNVMNGDILVVTLYVLGTNKIGISYFLLLLVSTLTAL